MTKEMMDHVFDVEGGFVNNPLDKGGPTNFGITQKTLSRYLARPASVDDVKNMKRETATLIYKKDYFDAMKLSLIDDARVQLMLFDQGINRGPKTAVMHVQNVLNSMGEKLQVDGEMGPITAAAINTQFTEILIREFRQYCTIMYIDIVKRKPNQMAFLTGWMNRLHKLEDNIATKIYDQDEEDEELPWLGIPFPILMKSSLENSSLKPYEWAKGEIGQTEIVGSKHNPRIVWYHSFTTLHATDDETPHCSSFMCAAAEENGYESTRSAAAKSWLNYGDEGNGSIGDICVLKRVGGHHVAFVNSAYTMGDSKLELLGSNQSNSVKVSHYDASNLLTFRRFPKK